MPRTGLHVPPLEHMLTLMRRHPLGTWVQPAASGLQLHHLPFHVDAQAGPRGRLLGHLGRRHGLSGGAWQASVVCFHGPQAYISPGWYPSKVAQGHAVPTWNYIVVHAHGHARLIDDRGWLREHLQALTAAHEAHQAHPWRLEEAPQAFIERGLDALIGIEFDIEALEGRWKCSQHRSTEDRQAVAAQLARSPQGAELADWMQRSPNP